MGTIIYESQTNRVLDGKNTVCFVQIREIENNSFILRKMYVSDDGKETVEEEMIKFEQIDGVINEQE